MQTSWKFHVGRQQVRWLEISKTGYICEQWAVFKYGYPENRQSDILVISHDRWTAFKIYENLKWSPEQPKSPTLSQHRPVGHESQKWSREIKEGNQNRRTNHAQCEKHTASNERRRAARPSPGNNLIDGFVWYTLDRSLWWKPSSILKGSYNTVVVRTNTIKLRFSLRY